MKSRAARTVPRPDMQEEKDGAAVAAATGDARRTANCAMGYGWERSRLLSSSSSSSPAAERMNPHRSCSCSSFCVQGGWGRAQGREPAGVSGRRLADVAAWELGRHPIQASSKERAIRLCGPEPSVFLVGPGLKRPAWQEAHPSIRGYSFN